jgi:hypothetical protein
MDTDKGYEKTCSSSVSPFGTERRNCGRRSTAKNDSLSYFKRKCVTDSMPTEVYSGETVSLRLVN